MAQPSERDDLRGRRLARSAKSGDLDAFSQLVAPHQRALFNAAYRITGNSQDAQDATQNALVRAFENLDRFDASRPFFSWAFKIVVREALRWIERESSRSDRFVAGAEDDATAVDDRPSPLDALSAQQQVERALHQIAPDHRVVIVLRHLHGLSYREIADTLEIPEKTVRSRLFDARQRLRGLLEHGR